MWCFIKFKESLDSMKEYITICIDKRQRYLLFTAPNERRPPGRTIQGVVPWNRVTASWNCGGGLHMAGEVG